MSFSTIQTFLFTPSVSANYTFDPMKIQITGTTASLIVPQTSGTLLVNQILNMKLLSSISATTAQTGSDGIKFHFKVNGSYVYFSTGAWVTSNQTYAQSNTVAEINAAAATLVTTNSTVQIEAAFNGSGTTTPTLTSLSLTYNVGPVFAPPAGECVVYAYLNDITNMDLDPVADNPRLIAMNDNPFFNNGHVVPRFFKSSTFTETSEGLLASIALENTVNSGNKVRFLVSFYPYGVSSRVETVHMRGAVIPSQTQVDLTDLTAIDTAQII